MKVARRMVREVITIAPSATVHDALHLLHQNDIRHLPVIDGKTFAGFVSEAELRQVLLLPGGNDMRIKDIMNTDPVTIGPEENLEEAARRIYEHRIDGLPVLEDGRLVGIVTVVDILAAFIEIMGVLQASSRIDIVLGEDPEAFESVSRIIKKKGGDIMSVGMGDEQASGRRCYFFRLNKCDVDVIAEALRTGGYEVMSVIQ